MTLQHRKGVDGSALALKRRWELCIAERAREREQGEPVRLSVHISVRMTV